MLVTRYYKIYDLNWCNFYYSVKVPSESGGHDSHGVVDALSAFPQVGGCEILSPSDYIYIEGVYQNSSPNRIGQVGSLRNLIAKISSRGDSLLGVLRSSFRCSDDNHNALK